MKPYITDKELEHIKDLLIQYGYDLRRLEIPVDDDRYMENMSTLHKIIKHLERNKK